MADDYTRAFGKHVLSLRRARRMTQEVLARRSGLELQPSTLFEGFELGHNDMRRELLELLSGRSPAELERLARIIRVLLEWGGLAPEDDEDGD